jgi:hypothetical protein
MKIWLYNITVPLTSEMLQNLYSNSLWVYSESKYDNENRKHMQGDNKENTVSKEVIS